MPLINIPARLGANGVSIETRPYENVLYYPESELSDTAVFEPPLFVALP
jgi:hypothetical protein